MSHMIATTVTGKSAIAYVGETPWHGLGQKLTANSSLDDWATESGLDFKLAMANVKYEAPSFGENVLCIAQIPTSHSAWFPTLIR